MREKRSSALLMAYVIAASGLIHLALWPAWAYWLDRRSAHAISELELSCDEGGEQRPDQQPCGEDKCPAGKTFSVQVSWEREEKPEPPPAEQYVVTPKQVEESEEAPEEGFAATVNTKVEKQTVARGGYEKRPATRRGQQKSHSKVAGQPPRAAIELPKNMREGEGAESKETSADLFETEDYIVPNFGAELLAAASEEGRTMDYLVDVEEGERTLINRRDHNYAAFYERFKQAVANHWSPAKVYRRRDPTGKIYGVDDRLTVLSVTLSGDGEIKEIYVDESCGLSFLDDEALRAMKAAAPFPNPPEGLKGLDGTMKIKFGFMLTISTGSFKLFRYR